MKYSVRNYLIFATAGIFALSVAALAASPPMNVRGTIAQVDGNTIAIGGVDKDSITLGNTASGTSVVLGDNGTVQMNAAGTLLRSVKPFVSTINEVYLDDFSAGKIDLGITYSGDALRTQAARKAKNDIRVNALTPGYVETEMNRPFWSTKPGLALIARIPQKRIGRPEDLDGALLLLASDASRHMTGSNIVVDGGHLCSSM